MPTHIVRYEDLLSDPYDTLINLFQFLLSRNNSLKGLEIESVIREISNSANPPEVYKPRCGKANGSFKYYSNDQLDYIKSKSVKYLRRFGYLKCCRFENPSGILTEDDESEELFYDSYDHWMRGFNSEMLATCLKFRDDYPDMKVRCSKVATIINNPEEIDKYKAKRHKGWRVHREKVRHIMRQQITPAELETLIK